MSEEEKTEKTTMKESELIKLIKDTQEEGLKEFAKKELGEKVDILLNEQKEAFGVYAKDQLKEQMQDVLSKYKVDPDIKEADEKTSQFKSFGDFLLSIRKFRINRDLDERLAFIDKDGKLAKTAGHMEIGEDSQGGYGPNAHLKPDHMLETPKALNTTNVIALRM